MARTLLLVALVASAALLGGGCDDSSTSPSDVSTATLAVGSETFRVALTTPQQVAAARAAQGGGRARIPNGRIVAGAQVNTGWTWHLEDVEFVEVAIELCDGRPSDVERQGTAFGGGRFCPWSATVTRVEER
ncbi:MAG TPA: hypothetical protein VF310_02640 [Vicinamibacteria bacterium]|jgi:hypothetical protein